MVDAQAGKYMKTWQVAKFLQLSEQTIIKWRKSGKGPAWIKDPEGGIHYERVEVEAWIRSRERRDRETNNS